MNLLSDIVEGKTPQEVDTVVKYMLERKTTMFNNFFLETHKILKENNYETILISGGADFIIRNIAEKIEAQHYATKYEYRNGVYIPQQPVTLNGELKADIIREITDENTHTISFGDSEGDYPMFELTNKAFLYTTSQEQINEAKEKGWSVINDENAIDEISKELNITKETTTLS